MENKALRYDNDKIRMDLLPTDAITELAKVLSFGAKKYAPNNWRKGMEWSRMIGSLKRHLSAIERGEDYDPETGLLHSAHVMCNAAFLTEYYKIYPQGDDRPHNYLNRPKIGLDIDEVLCDWLGEWRKLYNLGDPPTSWFFDRQIRQRFNDMENAGTLEPFYANLKPLLKPEEIPFEPHCYITSRPCTLETTIKWLDNNKFPTKPVFCVGVGQSKVDIAKTAEVDIFVDDSYDNFVALNKAGICCYLYDAPHNRRYDVGHKRIKSLKELV